jgi:hypothetical protein
MKKGGFLGISWVGWFWIAAMTIGISFWVWVIRLFF